MTHAPKYQGPNAAKYDPVYDKIETVVTRFKDSIKDGFQFKDLGTWHTLISECYDVAKQVFGPNFTKEDLTDLCVYVYWAIDPNIPVVVDPIETWLERRVIEEFAIPLAVGSAWEAVSRYIASR